MSYSAVLRSEVSAVFLLCRLLMYLKLRCDLPPKRLVLISRAHIKLLNIYCSDIQNLIIDRIVII